MSAVEYTGTSKADSAYKTGSAGDGEKLYSNIVAARGKRRFTLMATADGDGLAGAIDSIKLKASRTGSVTEDLPFPIDLSPVTALQWDEITAKDLGPGTGKGGASMVLYTWVTGSGGKFAAIEMDCPYAYVRAECTVVSGIMDTVSLQLEAHD